MKQFLMSIACLAALNSASIAIAAKPAAKIPALLQEVEARYAKAGSITAQVTKTENNAATQRKMTSSGIIQFKLPNKIRWEMTKPERSLLVSDGNLFWQYLPGEDGERGQYYKVPASRFKTKLVTALLSGKFSSATDAQIKEKSPSVFVLIPKKGTAGTVASAEIKVNADSKVVERVTLEHRGGNKAEFNLSQVELGSTMAEDLFKFKPPADADLIKE
jgi:outer membrane lipoprotein carrier protein